MLVIFLPFSFMVFSTIPSEFPGNEVKIVGQAFKVNKSIIPDGNFFSGDTTMVDSCYVVVARDYNELEKVAAILRDKKHAGIYQYEFHVDIDGTNIKFCTILYLFRMTCDIYF